MVSSRLRLPPRGHLANWGTDNAIERYFRPIIGTVMRQRLVWVRDALPTSADRMLEIGVGSGVFQYELTRHSRMSVGVDTHAGMSALRRRLAADGVACEVVRADGMTLPFADQSFDAVVIVSALEYMPHPDRCLRETARVLRPGGRLVCLLPRRLRWSDTVHHLLVGNQPEEGYRGGRERALHAIDQVTPGAERLRRPGWLPPFLAPYEMVVFQRVSPDIQPR